MSSIMSRIMARVLLAIVMFEEISCQWIMNLNIQAKVLLSAELVGDEACCCDTNHCTSILAQLNKCTKVSECQVEVTIKLTDCKTCPSVCCLIYDVGFRRNVDITDASFQINGDPSRVSETSVNVTLREIDGTFQTNFMDTVEVIVPLEETTEFTEASGYARFGIVEFTFRYNISSKVEDMLGPSMSCPVHKEWTTATVHVFQSESPSSSRQRGLLVILILMTLVVIITTTLAILIGAFIYQKKVQIISDELHITRTDSDGAHRPKGLKKITSQISTWYYMYKISTKVSQSEERSEETHTTQEKGDFDMNENDIYQEIEEKHVDERSTAKPEVDLEKFEEDIYDQVK